LVLCYATVADIRFATGWSRNEAIECAPGTLLTTRRGCRGVDEDSEGFDETKAKGRTRAFNQNSDKSDRLRALV
jgi:hypothetical protein